MDRYTQTFNDLFKKYLSPIKISVFFNANLSDNFECLYSTTSHYQTSKTYSNYEIPSLLRILTLKKELFSEEVLEQVYKDKIQELCFILEWGDHARKVLVFDTSNLTKLAEYDFASAVNDSHQILQELFQKIYYQSRSN